MKKSKILEDHIGYWLRAVSNQVSLSFAKRLAGHDVGVGEWVVLNLLKEHESLSPAEIAQMIGITRGASSKLLDRLHSKQLILRKDSIHDRRYQEISISDEGRKLLPQLIHEAEMNEQHFFSHLSSEQKTLLIKQLKGISSMKHFDEIPIN